jgi:hypothetical protein
MQASQIYSDVGSSKPFISGNFSTSSAIDALTDGFIGTVVDLIEELMEETTIEMQDAALMDPEWAPYASYLTVDVEDGNINYGYDAGMSMSEDIDALEYGTIETSPNPLIRSFAVRNKSEFNNDLKDKMAEELNFG